MKEAGYDGAMVSLFYDDDGCDDDDDGDGDPSAVVESGVKPHD